MRTCELKSVSMFTSSLESATKVQRHNHLSKWQDKIQTGRLHCLLKQEWLEEHLFPDAHSSLSFFLLALSIAMCTHPLKELDFANQGYVAKWNSFLAV